MDIRGFDSADDTAALNACNQVRARVDLAATDQSALYLAPDPATGTSHPQKFPAGQFLNNFKAPVDRWIQAEKTAP